MPDSKIEVSHESKKRVGQEKLAFGIIRTLSLLTIVILGLIMGFILYKGLWFSNETRSTVLPYAENSPDGMALVVNRETPLKSIDFTTLYGMYTDEYINWSKINADDFDLLPVAIATDKTEGQTAAKLLFGDGNPSLWGHLVKTVPDAQAALAIIRATPGSCAIVPSSDAQRASADGRIRIVPLKRIVLAVSDDAAALVDNKSLEDLDDAAIAKLTSGQIKNWKELGGPDLAVKLLAPPSATAVARALAASGYQTAASPVSGQNTQAYIASIQGGSGAVGYVLGGEAQAAGLSMLTRKGHESGLNLTWNYLIEEPKLSGRVGGISTIILNTLFMLILTIIIAAPIGVAAAVYLVEYAKQGPLVRILRLGTETLAGIPSIIFGLFGFLFFVNILHFGFGLLSGCLTLSLMILPTIVRTSEEALKSVPRPLHEGSLALGATKLQTIVKVAIPAAASGILTGLILGIGRAVGETAALIFTMGSDYKLAKGLFSSARVLSAHVYLLFAEGISFDRAFSTAFVLIVIVLLFNFLARRLVGRIGQAR